jgi:FKBP-type peptidyl-prolyl cis-trans isomerase SlyD
MSDLTKVQDDCVVSMDYTLHVDGELVDSSTGNAPLEFLQGAGNIIPGLEDELYGMAIGETKKVIIAPADAYGEFDDDALIEIPRAEFPAEIPMEEGIQLQVTDEEGNPQMAFIDSVTDDVVTLDFNHPLAGKELHFEVTIVALREATEEEIEHGHVHGDEHHH